MKLTKDYANSTNKGRNNSLYSWVVKNETYCLIYGLISKIRTHLSIVLKKWIYLSNSYFTIIFPDFNILLTDFSYNLMKHKILN